ncbi:MAG: hypothetical protein ABIW19_14590 [Vicinamibacterales bacterium]
MTTATYLADRLDVLREIEQIDRDLAQFIERHGETPEVSEMRIRQQRTRARVVQQLQAALAALAFHKPSAVAH